MIEVIIEKLRALIQGIVSLDLIEKVQLLIGKGIEVLAKVGEILIQIKDWLFGVVTKFFGG